jgi:hypothetical protein
MEASLLENFDGIVAGQFGGVRPKPGPLLRAGSGFRLSHDGKDYDLGDPRHMKKGELNDAERNWSRQEIPRRTARNS